MVNWRRLLVVLAQPWTTPTIEQLIVMATTMGGRVNGDEYKWSRMWLDESEEDRDYRLKLVSNDFFNQIWELNLKAHNLKLECPIFNIHLVAL